MVATIATRQLHFFFSSSFPIEEKRTNPFARYGKQISDISSFSSSSDIRIFSKLLEERGNRWWLRSQLERRKNEPFPTGFHPSPFQQFSSCYGKQTSDISSFSSSFNIRIFSKLWKREGKGWNGYNRNSSTAFLLLSFSN